MEKKKKLQILLSLFNVIILKYKCNKYSNKIYYENLKKKHQLTALFKFWWRRNNFNLMVYCTNYSAYK